MTKVANPVMAFLVKRFGLKRTNVWVLIVSGRSSGNPRHVPVTPLDYEGARYLVCPRGESDWVKNLRAAGRGTLQSGQDVQTFTSTEIEGEERAKAIREYIHRWPKVASAYFGIGTTPTLEQAASVADQHPVFEIS